MQKDELVIKVCLENRVNRLRYKYIPCLESVMCNPDVNFDTKKEVYTKHVEKDPVFQSLSEKVFDLLKHPEAKVGYVNYQWYLNGRKFRINTAILDLTKNKPTDAIIDEWTFNKDTTRL